MPFLHFLFPWYVLQRKHHKKTMLDVGKRMREPWAGISSALHDAGVGETAIVALVQKVKTTESQGDVVADLGKRLKDAVETTVKCSGPIKLKKGGPRIVALVGPTGVERPPPSPSSRRTSPFQKRRR
jgi:flagellar biosynthesis protein FlhF